MGPRSIQREINIENDCLFLNKKVNESCVKLISYIINTENQRSFLNCQYFEFMLAARKLLAAFIKLKVSRCLLYAALLVTSSGKLRDVSTIWFRKRL